MNVNCCKKYRSQDLGKKLLPAIDNLERAMAANVEEDQAANEKRCRNGVGKFASSVERRRNRRNSC